MIKYAYFVNFIFNRFVTVKKLNFNKKWPFLPVKIPILVIFGQNVPVVFKRENFERERSLQKSPEEVFRSSPEDEEIIFESRKTSNSNLIPRSIGDKLSMVTSMVTN